MNTKSINTDYRVTAFPILEDGNTTLACAMPQALCSGIEVIADNCRPVIELAGQALSIATVAGRSNFKPDEWGALYDGIATLERRAAASIIHHDSIKQAEFDQIFSVRRSDDSSAAVIASITRGVVVMLDQLRYRNSLSATDERVLINAFQETIYSFEPNAYCKPSFVSLASDIDSPICDPKARWVGGHWIFIALCQAMLITAGKLERAIEAKNWEATEALIELLNVQMCGMAPAFQLAGGLDKAQYEVVRQRMMPPMAPKGFSGLWMADHIELLRVLGIIRKNESFFPDAVQRSVAKFLTTVNIAYTAHVHVCEIVAGKTTSIAAQSSSSAPEARVSLVAFAKQAFKRLGLRIT